MSQPIRSESNDLMSGCVPYLMRDITTPLQPVTLIFLYNLLGYTGQTIVKPVLCLELDPRARALGCSEKRLYCLVEVPPSCPAPIKT